MKKQSKNKLEKTRPSFWWRMFAFFFTIGAICVAAVAVYVLIVFLQMPSLDAILNETRAPVITFLARDGREIRSDNRIMGDPVSVETLPPHVWQAIVAIEDRRFFEHGAIDPRGIMRAVFTNLIRGDVAMGGSSIAQQTAKNIFLSREKKISRKIQELILSYWLENRFDKHRVLDLYMNRVSLAGGLRGIDAAARILFHHGANDLTVAESAQIAAMLKAPTTYSPRVNPDKNIARAKLILKEMVHQGYITLETARMANKQLRPAVAGGDTNLYRYWTDFVLDEVKSRVGVINSDLRIYTTLDMRLQERVAAAISGKSDKYQGAGVAMSRDGALRAMVGGTDYQVSQFNRALAMRQPGSAFKPIVYLVALENGMTPDSFVNDSPFGIGDYNPKNYNERYYGDISLATAFAKSVNSVPLKLTEQFGISGVLQMAARLGVGSKMRREYSTVLGASEMTLLELTTVYDIVFGDGLSVRPYSITKITSGEKTIYEHNPSEPLQLLSLDTVGYMRELLADVVAVGGTGRRAYADGVLGGKTGTSNNNRDAWFVGAIDTAFGKPQRLTIGIWVGNDDFTPMDSGITGGILPAEIFKEIVK